MLWGEGAEDELEALHDVTCSICGSVGMTLVG